MPVGHRNLRDNQGGFFIETIIKDFEQILCRRQLNWVTHPIVQDQDISFVQGSQEREISTIFSGTVQSMQKVTMELDHRIG